MKMLLTLLERELKLAESQLMELNHPLAQRNHRKVREVLIDVQTLMRLEERGERQTLRNHVIGDRPWRYPKEVESKERGCTCRWWGRGFIAQFDPECPVGAEHNRWPFGAATGDRS